MGRGDLENPVLPGRGHGGEGRRASNVCEKFLIPHSSPAFPICQSDHARAAQGDRNSPRMVEDVFPIKHRKLRHCVLIPGSWWPSRG